MRYGFIGAGKVGFSLGRYLREGGEDIAGYFSSNPASAKEAAEFTGSRAYDTAAELLADCDRVFLTVPDGAIASVAEELKKLDISGKVLCHCSGATTAEEAFGDLASLGAAGCSAHPLFPVSDKYSSYKELGKAFFCVEGDEAPREELAELFRRLGNPVRTISGGSKVEYHAACAISSNLVCALVAESVALLGRCGFSEEEALAALRPLAEANLGKIFKVGPAAALTGPVERNDVSTVEKHLRSLPAGVEREAYAALTRLLVGVAERKHTDCDYSVLKKLLSDK